MVELQIVVLVVAGSSPVGPPPPPRGRGTTAWQARLRKSQVPESNLQTGGLVLGFWNLRFEISASGGVARPVLKIQRMSNPNRSLWPIRTSCRYSRLLETPSPRRGN